MNTIQFHMQPDAVHFKRKILLVTAGSMVFSVPKPNWWTWPVENCNQYFLNNWREAIMKWSDVYSYQFHYLGVPPHIFTWEEAQRKITKRNYVYFDYLFLSCVTDNNKIRLVCNDIAGQGDFRSFLIPLPSLTEFVAMVVPTGQDGVIEVNSGKELKNYVLNTEIWPTWEI